MGLVGHISRGGNYCAKCPDCTRRFVFHLATVGIEEVGLHLLPISHFLKHLTYYHGGKLTFLKYEFPNLNNCFIFYFKFWLEGELLPSTDVLEVVEAAVVEPGLTHKFPSWVICSYQTLLSAVISNMSLGGLRSYLGYLGAETGQLAKMKAVNTIPSLK